MTDPPGELQVETKWLKLGLGIAVLHALFLVLIVGLLSIDVQLALLAAVVLGTAGGVALVVFVLYYY